MLLSEEQNLKLNINNIKTDTKYQMLRVILEANLELMKPIDTVVTTRTKNATTQLKNFLIKKLQENENKHIFEA